LTNVTKYAKKVAAIAMAAVMLVGLTACSSSAKEKERNLAPEEVAEEALLSLTNTDAKTAFEDVFGWDELAKAIQKKGYKATIELSIEDIPGDMIGLNGFITLSTTGLSILLRAKLPAFLKPCLILFQRPQAMIYVMVKSPFNNAESVFLTAHKYALPP
jgi:hypothetical protein